MKVGVIPVSVEVENHVDGVKTTLMVALDDSELTSCTSTKDTMVVSSSG